MESGCGANQQSVIQELLAELHSKYLDLDEGLPASYIPELAKACPDDFGIVLVTSDGHCYEVGEARKEFTIQSISKPFIYALGIKTLSLELMAEKIDVEPSGEAFNALSLHPETGKPRNPMINAGAIAASALLCNVDPVNAEDIMLDYFEALAGRRLTIDQSIYLSEKETGHRNRAIGYMLRNFGIIDVDPEPALDLYFRQCSISVTCRDLAIMGATLACQGRNPVTGRSILSPEITVPVLALMGSCGMYDFAGQWLHDVGIPAKSGVAGGVMAVMPGRFGIAVYSPPLDGFGNSVRGIAVCKELSSGVGLSLFNEYPHPASTIRRSYRGSQRSSRRWRTEREIRILEPQRDSIRIIHIQGVLDFGAIEQIASQLMAMDSETKIIILDLGYVTQYPAESIRLLDRQLSKFLDEGVRILMTRADHLNHLAILDEQASLLQGRVSFYANVDTALETAENILIARHDQSESAITMSDQEEGFLRYLSPGPREILASRMALRHYQPSDVVIRRGESGEELFLVRSGCFTTTLGYQGMDGKPCYTRLATFGPGMCFGEI